MHYIKYLIHDIHLAGNLPHYHNIVIYKFKTEINKHKKIIFILNIIKKKKIILILYYKHLTYCNI